MDIWLTAISFAISVQILYRFIRTRTDNHKKKWMPSLPGSHAYPTLKNLSISFSIYGKWPCAEVLLFLSRFFLVWSTFGKTVTKGAESCLSNVVGLIMFPSFPAVEQLLHVWKNELMLQVLLLLLSFFLILRTFEKTNTQKNRILRLQCRHHVLPFPAVEKTFPCMEKMTSRCKFCYYYRHFSYFTHIWTDRQKCEVCGKNERGSSFFHIWKGLWKLFHCWKACERDSGVTQIAFCSILNYLSKDI